MLVLVGLLALSLAGARALAGGVKVGDAAPPL